MNPWLLLRVHPSPIKENIAFKHFSSKLTKLRAKNGKQILRLSVKNFFMLIGSLISFLDDLSHGLSISNADKMNIDYMIQCL